MKTKKERLREFILSPLLFYRFHRMPKHPAGGGTPPSPWAAVPQPIRYVSIFLLAPAENGLCNKNTTSATGSRANAPAGIRSLYTQANTPSSEGGPKVSKGRSESPLVAREGETSPCITAQCERKDLHKNNTPSLWAWGNESRAK